ncbi:hypothetical protein [Lyngbya sp. PCC 8106]|uniref:hypothetical protein n=1 Tax=Lyngbya sp. (strain PCC 8106) TaxID=313612 RepID=UPI0000EA98B4|nr:hypothetical protein [Lyngbya sp. PCC 8106]EAW35212.1 hypothetical protein L8106_13895 [Lyngbya sp. PCC 8106]
MNNPKKNLEREKWIHRYIVSLDEGDMDGIAEVLDAALYDPELEKIIAEITLAYHDEELTNIRSELEKLFSQ